MNTQRAIRCNLRAYLDHVACHTTIQDDLDYLDDHATDIRRMIERVAIAHGFTLLYGESEDPELDIFELLGPYDPNEEDRFFEFQRQVGLYQG